MHDDLNREISETRCRARPLASGQARFASGEVAAILLASGDSKRFGKNDKLAFPFRGKPLALYALELVSKLEFPAGIFFVAASGEVISLAADFPTINVIKNNSSFKGQRESVRLGVEAAMDAAYYLFFNCDQPFLDDHTVHLIVNERKKGHIVEPRYQGEPGNPCLFSADFREELLSLKEGETPRIIKTRHPEAVKIVEVFSPLVLKDIDDMETIGLLEKIAGSSV